MAPVLEDSKGYIGVILGRMENQTETTIMGYIGFRVHIGKMNHKMETIVPSLKVQGLGLRDNFRLHGLRLT